MTDVNANVTSNSIINVSTTATGYTDLTTNAVLNKMADLSTSSFLESSSLISRYNKSTTLSNDISAELHDFYVKLINDKMFEETLLPSMIYLIVLLCIGLPGNLLVCYIYHKKDENSITGNAKKHKKKKSSDIFILALAWLDILNCILSLPVEIFLLRYFVQFDHPWICKLSRYAAMVFNAASSFVLMGIAVDRFIGIKYSQSKYRFTKTTAVKIVAGSVSLAFAISLPGIALYGTQTLPLSNGIYGKTCLIEDHFVHTKYPLILSMFLLSVHFLFDILFIILYGIVGKKIIKNRNLSSIRLRTIKTKMNSKQPIDIAHITFNNSLNVESLDKNCNIKLQSYKNCGSENSISILKMDRDGGKTINSKVKETAVHGNVYNAGKTTFMLLAVTITFMVTFAPYCAIAILRSVSPDDFYSNLSKSEKAIYQLFLRSYLLSSAANPIIYSFLSDKFRQQCRNIIRRMFKC